MMRAAIGLVPAVVLSGVAALSVRAQGEEATRFAGGVRHGETFEKTFDDGLIFRLTPSNDPATPGWRIEIFTEQGSAPARELSWVVTPPYRGNNPRYIQVAYGQSAKEVVAHTPRRFRFVTTLLHHFRASSAVGNLLWPADAPPEQLEAARQKLDSIPKGDGSLRIIDFKLAPARDGKPAYISLLKFEVKLSMPVGRPSSPVSARSIREAPLDDELAEAFLADVTASVKCPQDRAPAAIRSRSFGDLDGDGIEEVALTGDSCLAGNNGPDLFVVLRLLPNGRLARMPVPLPESGNRAGGSWWKGCGLMNLSISGGKLIEIFSKRPDDPRSCPSDEEGKLVLEWDGQKFVRKSKSGR